MLKFFFGTFYHNLDEKNRLTLPSKMRELAGNTVYVTLGLGKCIWIFPESEFEKIVAELKEQSYYDPQMRDYLRTFFANSYPFDIDKAGRVYLDRNLLRKVSIKEDHSPEVKRECTVLGVDNHIEVWDKATYDKVGAENEDKFEENATKIHINSHRL